MVTLFGEATGWWKIIVTLQATAIPLETELKFLTHSVSGDGGMAQWFFRVRDALVETNAKYPFLACGTDWLAFAHFVIAIAFIGPLRDPVKNIWVIEFGMIACMLVCETMKATQHGISPVKPGTPR